LLTAILLTATLLTATLLTESNEDELLANAVHYDEAALGELYDRYEAKIYSYIFRRTGEQALAEDLTAQVFLKMLEAIQQGKAWHSSFSGWLYRIAHNLVIDHYRNRGRQGHVELDETEVSRAPEHNPVLTAEMNLDAERLRAAVRRLTDEQAEVISLRFLEGYSILEVAEMMDKSEGSIKALQYRAVATLRNLLQHEQLR
jgi:RNA polymerase sigma-70 factor, ECF subfamily